MIEVFLKKIREAQFCAMLPFSAELRVEKIARGFDTCLGQSEKETDCILFKNEIKFIVLVCLGGQITCVTVWVCRSRV